MGPGSGITARIDPAVTHGDHPDPRAVKASIRRHDPDGKHTIDDDERGADRVELLTAPGAA